MPDDGREEGKDLSLYLFGPKQEEEIEECRGGRSRVPTFYG